MKINEYKDEVRTLALSAEFKEKLKQQMLEEYEKQSGGSKPEIKKSAGGLNRYRKYIALAACLLLVVSTVGVVSVAGLRSKFNTAQNSGQDNAADAVTEEMRSAEIEDPEALIMPESAEDYEVNGYEDVPTGDDNAVEDEDLLPATDGEEPASIVPEQVEEAEEVEKVQDADEAYDQEPTAVNPTSGNGFRIAASPDYDGNYDGGAYILDSDIGSATISADAIYESADDLHISTMMIIPPHRVDVPPGMLATGLGAAPDPNDMPSGYLPESGDMPDMGFEDAPIEYPESDEDTVEDEPDPGYLEVTPDTLIDSLSSEFSYEYYDIRDGVIADLDEIALVRFEIENAYCGFADVMANSMTPVDIDVEHQTLYDIKISYDYFNNEETDVTAQLINSGSKSRQLYGRPLMEGEYIAVVYKDPSGVLEPVSQLIYAVHRVNGLDIAYHVYSEDGFMVNPGDTNMGLMPEEIGVITSTVNNPEIYTQKAAVNELTYYLRRNIMRMDPELIDLESLGKPEDPAPLPPEGSPADTPAPAADQEEKDIKMTYGPGLLTYSNGKVNGIGPGDSLEDALAAFGLTDRNAAQKCTITLTSEEGWYVKVSVIDGKVTNVDPHL